MTATRFHLRHCRRSSRRHHRQPPISKCSCWCSPRLCSETRPGCRLQCPARPSHRSSHSTHRSQACTKIEPQLLIRPFCSWPYAPVASGRPRSTAWRMCERSATTRKGVPVVYGRRAVEARKVAERLVPIKRIPVHIVGVDTTRWQRCCCGVWPT